MRKYLPLTLVCALPFVFAACKQAKKTEAPVLELVYKRFDAMNKHNVDSIAVLYAPDAIIQSPNNEHDEVGPEGAKNVYTRYFTTSPDMVYKVTRVLSADSTATVEYTFSGTMKRLESFVPAYMLNKTYTIRCCSILEIKKGKIIADRSYFDQVAFLRQVGFFEQHP